MANKYFDYLTIKDRYILDDDLFYFLCDITISKTPKQKAYIKNFPYEHQKHSKQSIATKIQKILRNKTNNEVISLLEKTLSNTDNYLNIDLINTKKILLNLHKLYIEAVYDRDYQSALKILEKFEYYLKKLKQEQSENLTTDEKQQIIKQQIIKNAITTDNQKDAMQAYKILQEEKEQKENETEQDQLNVITNLNFDKISEKNILILKNTINDYCENFSKKLKNNESK